MFAENTTNNSTELTLLDKYVMGITPLSDGLVRIEMRRKGSESISIIVDQYEVNQLIDALRYESRNARNHA